MRKEIWKDVVGYEKYYMVSNLGRVKSKDRTINRTGCKQFMLKGRIKKQSIDVYGYYFVGFYVGVPKTMKVHRLVAIAFIANPKNKEQVNHKDFNRKNNILENLEWVTNQENAHHSYLAGRKKNINLGEKHPHAKLTENKVMEIRKLKKSGVLNYILAKKYKVTASNINSVVNYKTWKDI